MVVVAQLVRAPDCDSGGRGFESPLSPHFFPADSSVRIVALITRRNVDFFRTDGDCDFSAEDFEENFNSPFSRQ
jgi:hypothetical protein